MSNLGIYLPQDRLRALARNESLQDRTSGAALFADISGFTALTKDLRNTLGPRRGAEELTKYLDLVYSVLIAEVEKYGGAVIGFAGDAVDNRERAMVALNNLGEVARERKDFAPAHDYYQQALALAREIGVQ